MTSLQKAINHFNTQAAFAEAIGVTTQHVNNWKTRGVPAERAKAIEEATKGEVTRADLRPDIFG